MKINSYPYKTIIGEKTIIRRLEEKDLEKSLMWLKDPNINKYLSQNFSDLTKQQEDAWYRQMIKSRYDFVFAIDSRRGKYIGNCALHKINWFKKSAEFGIFIGDKEYWNRGYGSEAIKKVIRFALDDLKLKKILLNVYEYNQRAFNVYKKCGFRLKKILKKDHYYNNKFWNTLVMEYTENKSRKKNVHI